MPCAGRRNGGRGGGSTAAQEFPARRVARSGGLALRGHGVGEGRRPAEEQRIAGPVAVIGRGGCRNHQQARCTVHARCDGGSQRVPDGRGLASRKANGCDLYLCLCKRQRQQSNTSSRYRLPGTQHGGIIKHCAAPDLPFGRPFTAFCPLPPAPPPAARPEVHVPGLPSALAAVLPSARRLPPAALPCPARAVSAPSAPTLPPRARRHRPAVVRRPVCVLSCSCARRPISASTPHPAFLAHPRRPYRRRPRRATTSPRLCPPTCASRSYTNTAAAMSRSRPRRAPRRKQVPAA
jgi:hypothetical protein